MSVDRGRPYQTHQTKQFLGFPNKAPRKEIVAACAGRVPGLDGLRALSVMIVILGHYFLRSRGGFAALGVYMFFVISGFLITRLLFLELKGTGSVSLPKFYLRRLIRLYPVLIVYLLTICIADMLLVRRVYPQEIMSVIFYFTNYFTSYLTLRGQSLHMQIGVLWSLAIEEHFYIFMPIFFMMVRGKLKPMLIFSIVAIVIPLLIRCAYVFCWPEIIGQLITYRNSETRFDGIAYGVLIAVLCENETCRHRFVSILSSPMCVLLGFLVIAISAASPNALFKETLRFSLISIGCVPILCGAAFGKIHLLDRFMNNAVVAWVGRLSYSLYVWHGCTANYVREMGFSGEGGVTSWINLSAAFAISVISYYLVEIQFLKVRGRLEKSGKLTQKKCVGLT